LTGRRVVLEMGSRSEGLFERAERVIPGGVNSPARAFGAVGGVPIFFSSASGCRIVDVDDREYVDYVGSWGPFILGHQHPRVVEVLLRQVETATSFGAPCRQEVELAELITAEIDFVDMLRLVSSGTEATMSALRVARGYTGRNRVVKFAGCYHGHGDSFLINAGSGLITHGVPSSPGVTPGTAADTLIADYNDIDGVREIFEAEGGEIAAVIVEPVAGNMGVVPTTVEFLNGLRELCTEYGALLIFDEVMTGFRVAFGGASELYGVTPDLVTYGKIIGGGLPVGAYGGRREVMEIVSPIGPVYQAGTLSGNPLAVAAGLETLRILHEESPYDRLEELGARLEAGLRRVIAEQGREWTINRRGSMITLFFTSDLVTGFAQAKSSDTELFGRFFHEMLDRGEYLPPSQFESWFISSAHTVEDIDSTIERAASAISSAMKGERREVGTG
jgi:glutamate-1-semialdehyde 2,1-aminomutase